MRIVAHVDMDAFYASVEERYHPELRGRPGEPEAVFVRGDRALYAEVSGRIMAIVGQGVDAFEGAGIDEAYVDLSSLGDLERAQDHARMPSRGRGRGRLDDRALLDRRPLRALVPQDHPRLRVTASRMQTTDVAFAATGPAVAGSPSER